MNEQTTELLRDFGGELKEMLAEMAKGLGVAVEHLYIILIRQQIVEGIISIVIPLCLFLAFAFGARFYKKTVWAHVKKKQDNDDYPWHSEVPGAALSGFVVIVCLAIIALVVTIVLTSISIGRFINPEYYVLKNVTEMIGEAINGTSSK